MVWIKSYVRDKAFVTVKTCHFFMLIKFNDNNAINASR